MARDDERYRQARERVRELEGLYAHVAIFILVNLLLFVLNYLSSPGQWSFYWVTILWGIVRAWHVFSYLRAMQAFTSEWEEKKIREFMREDGNR